MKTLFFSVIAFVTISGNYAYSPYNEAAAQYPASYKSGPSALPEFSNEGDIVFLKWKAIDPVIEKRSGIESDYSGFKIFMARFSNDINLSAIRKIEDKDIIFLEKIPGKCCLVKASQKGLLKLRAMKEYRASFSLKPEDKIDPSLLEADWELPVIVEALLARGESPANLIDETKKNFFIGALGSIEKGIRLRWLVRKENIKRFAMELGSIDEVVLVSPCFLPRPLNDDSIWVIQSYDTQNKRNYPLSATLFNHGILGEGETGGVSDTGLDNDMCYFAYDENGFVLASYPQPPAPGSLDLSKKVIGYSVLPGATAYDNNAACGVFNNFHGTHTSCTMVGDNYWNIASTGDFGHDTGDGMAPMAKLYFQDVGEDTGGCLTGLANDYRDIFGQAYAAGVRVHSNSWGSNVGGNYTTDASIVDEFLYNHEDFALFFAAGNAGPLGMTIDSPAASKNCVAVGSLVDGSMGSNMVSDFSSRGPTQDGRIKPDIMAPGENIVSASGTSSSSDNNCGFKTMSGTSMATPTAAGGALLLRNYFTKGFYPGGEANAEDAFSPSATLLKAALIAGAMDVGSADIPNVFEGWGRINLDRFAFFSVNERDALRCAAFDIRNEAGLEDDEEMTFRINMEQGGPLKAVIAWLDPEGSPMSSLTLVNDLNLELLSPSGQTYLGNNFLQGASVAGGQADYKNNVEAVYIPEAAPGVWQIKIKGYKIEGTPREENSDRQGFALVVLKPAASSPAAAPSNFSAADSGAGGIQLSWDSVQGATSYSVYRIKGDGSDQGSPVTFLLSSAGTSAVDRKAQGGYSYTYFVRASNGGFEGPTSNRKTVSSTGECSLRPVFEGIKDALNDEQTASCDIVLSWDAAASQCPLDEDVSYNIYRGEAPGFSPSSGTLIASGVKALTYSDKNVPTYKTSYYIVRSEDSTTGGGGPANGGNEDRNIKWMNATPFGPPLETGDWIDDGGDTFALMSLESSWTISPYKNHTPFGLYCYAISENGDPYLSNSCAGAATPFLKLTGDSPALSYSVSYNLEYGWDGVVVEISEDGTNFITVNPDSGYPGSFMYTGNPPINRCLMPASQGAFSGPKSNDGPTSWAFYTHNLSAYKGKQIKIRWRFSSDPASEYDGFFLDDIKVTGVLLPGSCEGSAPNISFDRQSYNCSDTITVRLYDGKKKGTGAQTFNISSGSETTPETVDAVETPSSSGYFLGSIATESSAPSANGKLTVKDGDAIHASYTGVSKDAAADCAAPSLVSSSLVYMSPTEIDFKFAADENVTAEIRYGKPGQPDQTVADDLISESHSVNISSLDKCSDYEYEIKITDIAGNSYTKPRAAFRTKGCFPAPQISAVKKMSDPFRLIITGSGFTSDSLVSIGGIAVPETLYKSSSKLVAKKGQDLKNMTPKGTTVQIVVVNPGDMTSSQPFSYTR
jgi:hypothetical protein